MEKNKPVTYAYSRLSNFLKILWYLEDRNVSW